MLSIPFQVVFEDGSVLSGSYMFFGYFVLVQAVYMDPVDNVLAQISGEVTENVLGITLRGDIYVEAKHLGKATVDFHVTVSSSKAFGSTVLLEVDADFLPEDVIEWLCMGDPADDEFRLALLAQLPFIYRAVTWYGGWSNQDDEGFGEFEDNLFADHEVDEEGDLNGPPVRVDYIGRGERGLTVGEIVEEVLAKDGPISDLPADVIVAQVLAGNLDGRGSPQL